MNDWPSCFADFVDGADVGMVESRGRLCLPLETGQGLGILGDFLGQELQGDKAVEASVLGLVDDTHPAAAELLDDAVVRNGLADHLRECYGVRPGKSMYGLIARTPRRKFAEIWTSKRNP